MTTGDWVMVGLTTLLVLGFAPLWIGMAGAWWHWLKQALELWK